MVVRGDVHDAQVLRLLDDGHKACFIANSLRSEIVLEPTSSTATDRQPRGSYARRMPTPADVLAQLVRSDPARPRVTFYDDSVNAGERIELSAKVLANWVSKAANLLTEELEIERGDVVRLDLPAQHWRSLYWALAVWSVGATLDVSPTVRRSCSSPPTRRERSARGRTRPCW